MTTISPLPGARPVPAPRRTATLEAQSGSARNLGRGATGFPYRRWVNTPLQGDLPLLRRWMGDAPGHPLRHILERPSRYPGAVHVWWRDPILVALEEMLVLLEAVQPVGLASMARTFRSFADPSWTGMERFLQHRAELVVASLLAQAQVPFRFNTAGGADLLLQDEGRCAVEISSRSPKSLLHLSRTLQEGLRERGLSHSVSITADPIPPVVIRDATREEILRRLLPDDGPPTLGGLRLMAAPARPHDGIPASWVTVTIGASGTTSFSAPYNSPHMIALARDVAANVLREKRKIRQSRPQPTLLVVDVTGTDLPDLRCWEQVFDRIWEPRDVFVGLAAMVSHTTRRIPTLSFSINPYAARPQVQQLVSALADCPEFMPLQRAAASTR